MNWQINIPSNYDEVENLIEVACQHDGGMKQKGYLLTLDDLLHALARLKSDNFGAYVKAPILPTECIQYTENESGTKAKALFLYESTQVFVSAGLGTREFIYTPRTLVQYHLLKNSEGYKVFDIRMACVKPNEKVNDYTPLYFFPFPHVNKADSKVCMGGNNLELITKLEELNNVYKLFWGSPFSNDYEMKLIGGGNCFEVYVEKHAQQAFNHDHLVPMHELLENW